MNFEIDTEKKLNPSEFIKIHTHYLDHFFRIEQNEELQSEQRIKFFVAFAAIIITVISASDLKGNSLFLFLFFLILFTVGLLIYARVIWSDRKIKIHRDLWDVSYEAIKTLEPSIANYRERLDQMDENKTLRSSFLIVKGTLTQIMGLIEVLLFAANVYFFGAFRKIRLLQYPLVIVLLSSIVAILLSQWAIYVKNLKPKK